MSIYHDVMLAQKIIQKYETGIEREMSNGLNRFLFEIKTRF